MQKSINSAAPEFYKVENAYNELISYKKEVADFLIYVMGSHYTENSTWIKNAMSKQEILRNKRNDIALANLLHDSDIKEYYFSDGSVHSNSNLYAEYLKACRDVTSWLDSVVLYFMETSYENEALVSVS